MEKGSGKKEENLFTEWMAHGGYGHNVGEILLVSPWVNKKWTYENVTIGAHIFIEYSFILKVLIEKKLIIHNYEAHQSFEFQIGDDDDETYVDAYVM